MTRNIGKTDRIIRVIAGIVLLSLLFFVDSNLRWVGLIGLVPLLTAMAGNCPAYSLFGFSTCPLEQTSRS